MDTNTNIGLELSQQLGQRLSPRQVQFVRLLEMSGPEVEDEVRRQLDDNPALEVVDSDTPAASDSQDTEVDYNADPDDDPADRYPSRPGYSGEWVAPQIADDTPDLFSHLLKQIGELDLPPMQQRIALYIIGNIDENGYLTRGIDSMADDIAIATSEDITRRDVEEVLAKVRDLDPPGVGAVDLRNCLLLQLKHIRPVTLTSRIAREIISDNFDLFSRKHFDRLQAQLGVSKEEMQRAIQLIQTLNPKPGSAIAPAQSEMRISHITPDVMVECDDGRCTVSLVSSLPQLQVERTFTTEGESAIGASAASRTQAQARAFIKLKRDDAEAFILALRQRSSTLLAVTEAIVKLQPDFFATGETSRLKPMILKDVAALTGLDLSVISRATSGKYVATATGTYPLKMFFNEAPKEDSDTSSHQILQAIREIVDAEDKRHPLSDEAICQAMAAKGHDIARRTVTKYRERLGIPVGRLRKDI